MTPLHKLVGILWVWVGGVGQLKDGAHYCPLTLWLGVRLWGVGQGAGIAHLSTQGAATGTLRLGVRLWQCSIASSIAFTGGIV